MPLVVLAGGPLSGKTKVTEKLVAHVRKTYPETEIRVINLESLNLQRNVVYANMNNEKKLNGMIRTLVERSVSVKRLLIVDMCNLFKSFRYELYTRVNSSNTVSCTIYVDTPMEVAIERNKALQMYDEKVFQDLWNRFEEPLVNFRWEAPLFPVYPDSEPDVESIAKAVLGADIGLVVSLANTGHKLEDSNYVTMLNDVATVVTDVLIQTQQEAKYGEGGLETWGEFPVFISKDILLPILAKHKPSETSTDHTNNVPSSGFKMMKKKTAACASSSSDKPLSIILHKPATIQDLLELRRNFVRTAANMSLKNPTDIMSTYVEFLLPRL